MEPFQILRYEPGQFYKVHHDQNSGDFTPQGARVRTRASHTAPMAASVRSVHGAPLRPLRTVRALQVYTFFMYLSTPASGGGTRFHDLGVTVPAVKGNAVLWPSVRNADPKLDEPLTNHAGLPPTEGVKFASNVWIHQYDFRTPANANCLLTHKNTH